MNILMLDLFGSFLTGDLLYSFKKLGHKCKFLQYVLEDKEWNEEFAIALKKELQEGSFDMVFTTNYYQVVAKVCYLNNILHCCWVYDSPPEISSVETMDYPTNRIFFFCKNDYLHFKNTYGLDTVYYLPLAVNTERLDEIKADDRYSCDVSLVGGLYKSETLLGFKSIMTPEQQQYIDAMIQVQITRAGAGVIDAALTEDFIKGVCQHYRDLSETAVQPEKAHLFYAICAHVAHVERVSLLRLFGDRGYDTRLFFGNIKDQDRGLLADHNVKLCGNVSYELEMPKVFKSSKINLNPVLRANRGGIPLWAVDVLGCGGFLLTSKQSEMVTYFRDDELVTFGSIEEALEKADYYMAHESERLLIARKGYEKVKKDFSYEERVKTILSLCG